MPSEIQLHLSSYPFQEVIKGKISSEIIPITSHTVKTNDNKFQYQLSYPI